MPQTETISTRANPPLPFGTMVSLVICMLEAETAAFDSKVSDDRRAIRVVRRTAPSGGA